MKKILVCHEYVTGDEVISLARATGQEIEDRNSKTKQNKKINLDSDVIDCCSMQKGYEKMKYKLICRQRQLQVDGRLWSPRLLDFLSSDHERKILVLGSRCKIRISSF